MINTTISIKQFFLVLESDWLRVFSSHALSCDIQYISPFTIYFTICITRLKSFFTVYEQIHHIFFYKYYCCCFTECSFKSFFRRECSYLDLKCVTYILM